MTKKTRSSRGDNSKRQQPVAQQRAQAAQARAPKLGKSQEKGAKEGETAGEKAVSAEPAQDSKKQ